MFKDEAEIIVKAGNGGSGCVSFRREKFIPRGGPDGGDGGRGGDVVFQAIHNCRTLLDLVRQREYRAKNGGQGKGKMCFGKSGKPLIIQVPLGTLVKNERGEVLADLKKVDQQVTIVAGGRGGRGNTHFAKSDDQAPRIAEKGEAGEEKHLFLELKLIADVGLVGFPNAGKSTLLSRISKATPKIDSYPFTTLEPNLGIVELSDCRRLVFADIPGLLEGAHQGLGLGHKFLRHIERTAVLVYLVDIAPLGGKSPVEALGVLRNELASYSQELAAKPYLMAANKMDITEAKDNLRELQKQQETPVFPISAVTGKGINGFLQAVAKMVQDLR